MSGPAIFPKKNSILSDCLSISCLAGFNADFHFTNVSYTPIAYSKDPTEDLARSSSFNCTKVCSL